MKSIVFFLMMLFVFQTGESFGQKELGAQESFHYYFRIDKDTAIENKPLLLKYLNLYDGDAYQKTAANEFTRPAYLEKKEAELRQRVQSVDFNKTFLIPVFKGEISEYDLEKGGFSFNVSLRDSVARAISGKTIFSINNIININEFNDGLFFKMDNAAAGKFIKSIKKRKSFPNREVRFYCYYSIVDQKLMDIENRNYAGMQTAIDIYLQKIVVRASNGKRFTFLPNEKFVAPAEGFKTLTGNEYYYYKLNGTGNTKEFLCSQNDSWNYYKVVEKKDGIIINPVLTINRNGDTTAKESCTFYYPAAYVLDGTSKYNGHIEYGPINSSGEFWYPRTYIANYKDGLLEGVSAWYTFSSTSPVQAKLYLIHVYEQGKAQGYAFTCKENFVDAVYLFDNDKEISRQYFMQANQESLPDEVKKLFREYQKKGN